MTTKTIETRYHANGDKHTTTLILTEETLLSARDKGALKSAIVSLQAKWRKSSIPDKLEVANLDALCTLASTTQRAHVSFAEALKIILASAESSCVALEAIYELYPEHAPNVE